MPLKVKITDNGFGFIMIGEGIVTGEEIIGGVSERFSDISQTKKYIYGISDYTNVEQLKMSKEDIQKISRIDFDVATINPNLVISIAAPKDIIFGYSRMFSAYATDTGWDINIFRTFEEAKKSIIKKLEARYSKGITLKFE